ncbi:hypothetical protein Egran_01031, partial [Elaphomyces granulatus]
ITVGSNINDGTIILLDKSFEFSSLDPDDEVPVPDKKQFKIVTSATIPTPNNDVIGVSRGKYTAVPAPTTIVELKPNVTFTFTVERAVYIKANSKHPEGTVQPCPTDAASKVEFPGTMKKATVTEDNAGKFAIAYSAQ